MAGQLKGITVEIGGDTTKLENALKSVNNRVYDLKTELRGVETLLKMDPTNTELLSQKQAILTKSVEATKEKLQQLKAVQDQVQAQFEKKGITEEQYRDFQREIIATEQKLKSLTEQLKEFGTVGAQKVAAVGEKMQDLGGKIEAAGKKFMAISTVSAGALVGVAKSAIDFETAWTGVTKTVDGTDAQLEKIRQGILDLSEETGSSAEDIAAVAENAGQLGVSTGDVLDFTETMVRLGDSTNLSADEASSAIAKLYNIMGGNMNTVDKFGSSIVALGNSMATTEADILNMATRIAGSGTQIGLTEQEVLALAASLSSVGLEAEAGGTAISTIMSNIDKDVAKGSDNLKTWAEVAGVSVSDFKNLWENDAMGAIQLVVGGLGDASKGGENLNLILDELGITSIRQTDTMKRMSGASDLLTNAVKISNEAWAENTALTDESNKRYETTAAKIQQLKNTLTELCVSLGDILLPIVQSVVDGLKGFVDRLTQMSPVAQKISLAVLALVAALGPVLIVVGKLIGSIGTIMTFAPQIVTVVGTIKAALSGLFAIMLANPVGLIIAGIAAVVSALVLLYNKCEWFRNAVNSVFAALKTILNSALVWFQNLPQRLQVWLSNAITTVSTWASNMAAKARQAGSNFLAEVVSFFQQLPSRIMTFLSNALTAVGTWGSNLAARGKIAAQKLVTTVVNGIKELPSKLKDIGKNLVQGLWEGISGMTSWLWDNISGFASGVLDGLKDAFGVNSPSRETAWIGKMLDYGLAQGVDSNAGEPISAMRRVAANVLGSADAEMASRALNQTVTQSVVNTAAAPGDNSALLEKLDGIYERLGRLQVVMNGRALVGEIIDDMDAALGSKQQLAARGV